MKAKVALVVTFLVSLVAFNHSAHSQEYPLGQILEINERQYIRATNGAADAEAKYDRRVKSTEAIFVDGKKTVQFEISTLYVSPNRRHSVSRTIRGEKEETEETIQIGSDQFVRQDGGKWVIKTGSLLSGIPIPNSAKNQYTYERRLIEGKSVNVFRSYSEYVSEESRDKGAAMYFEQVVHLDGEGFRLRTHLNRGYVGSKCWEAKQTVTYEYKPKNVKIEAPIKLGKKKRTSQSRSANSIL